MLITCFTRFPRLKRFLSLPYTRLYISLCISVNLFVLDSIVCRKERAGALSSSLLVTKLVYIRLSLSYSIQLLISGSIRLLNLSLLATPRPPYDVIRPLQFLGFVSWLHNFYRFPSFLSPEMILNVAWSCFIKVFS